MWNVRSRVENELPKSNNARERFCNALSSSFASTHPYQWRSFKALEQELESSSMKNTQLLSGNISNKKKLHPIVDSKVKRQLKIFDDSGDAEKLITNSARMIKF